jgi:hypothetical protein
LPKGHTASTYLDLRPVRRRTEIIIEVERVLVARRRTTRKTAWCDKCGQEVAVVTPDKAARIAGASVRLIYRWLEADLLHFNEDPEGVIDICRASLLASGRDV